MNKLVTTQTSYNRGAQQLAWVMLLTFCFGLFSPTVSIAGGGGPTQPEVQGFTPIGVSDLVDPFTGDFRYNIPLMDVEGYPINIAYSSGITMDQEASWVGLGWNLNMGAIVRNMRGLPDDFAGDEVVKTQTTKPMRNVGVSFPISTELFGLELLEDTNVVGQLGLNLNANVSINYSNYQGYGVDFSFGPSFSLKKKNGLAFQAGLNFVGSSENGMSFSPSASLSKSKEDETGRNEKGVSSSIGAGYNSRAGLQQLSYGLNMTRTMNKSSVNKWGLTAGFGSSYDMGLHHYSPSSSSSMITRSFSGNVAVGSSFVAFDIPFPFSVSYNVQKMDPDQTTRSNPAYGYFNLEKGQYFEKALLDFNRDNDGSFTKYTPNLPSAFLTNDFFTVQAQGIGGSYRAFRNEIGYVCDPTVRSNSTSGNLGLEFGVGNAADLGIDLTFNVTTSTTGAWNGYENQSKSQVHFEPASGLLEEYALQEANERSVESDNMFETQYLNATPQYFPLSGPDMFPNLEDKVAHKPSGSTLVTQTLSTNNRTERYKRNQLLSFLTIADLQNDLGLNEYNSAIYGGAKGHHIGEMTQLGTDGRRYVFGIPAYNHLQEDVTFATGNKLGGGDGVFPTDQYSGIIDLESDFAGMASSGNQNGIDEYYSSETTPAYAHSFLLSAVLSDDYTDSDAQKGPSDNDLGSFVKFDYTKIDNVKWRTPIAENTAYHNEGLKTDKQDDKASFVYGEKDVWYVKAVETKNYIAIFEISSRDDGAPVNGRNGGLNASGQGMKKLTKISLYAKPDYQANGSSAKPIQEVHFEYDYSLCPGYPGNINGGGKLTLKEIYFTYQGSYKMKRSSYEFDYTNNANYNLKAVDRWGTYKATGTGTINYNTPDELTTSDDPYTVQDETEAANNASKWCLTDIFLPSGGKIHVNYESDDYAYVQHLRASQMFPIVGTEDDNGNFDVSATDGSCGPMTVSDDDRKNRSIFVKLKPGYDDINDYASVNQPMFFRCLMEVRTDLITQGNNYEYVSGYGIVEELTTVEYNGEKYGEIRFKPTKLLDNGNEHYSSITKAAILFARMNLSRTINDSGAFPSEPDGSETSLVSFANAVINSITSFGEMITGPNKAIYDLGKCQRLIPNKSFVRLLEPSKRKFGGGARVESILMYDNWDYMVRNSDPSKDYSFTYGQKFDYTLEDGTSSGVATYEPQIGGDENTWHQPHFYNEKFRLAPDNNLFLEKPIMESQFPSPSVGYSRVTITDLKHDGVNRHATGKVVKEFYTAKDFPTIVKNTDVDLKTANSFLPVLPQYSYMAASQGFSLELNDMHGKPKSEAVFAEDKVDPISRVDYDYQKTGITYMGVQCFQLDNSVRVIKPNGTTVIEEVGIKYDAVADFRENETNSMGGSVNINLNSFFAAPLPLVVPTIWPKLDISVNRFRTATLSKVVNRFGIQNRTTANQDGSIVETNNLAYDSETGEVLATQTTTNFNDKVYSLNYPAYWKYDEMGPAYQNIGYSLPGIPVSLAGFATIPPSDNKFILGDEVKVSNSSFTAKAWVVEKTGTGIYLVDEYGQPVPASSSSTITIIRSGRRNKQTTSMANITTLEDPIGGLVTSTFNKVLNTGAVEYKQDWATYCNCFSGSRENEDEKLKFTTNPYVNSTKGVWRPVKSYTYLTNRTQSNVNNNTDIRRDGVFTSYSPYYKYSSGSWNIDPSNWTYVSEVTQFSPNGMTLETRDALGRYSANLFGFNNTLTTAVSANARIIQIAEGSFEDREYTNCMDQSVFSTAPLEAISTSHAHTGRNSIAVGGGQSIQFSATATQCCGEEAPQARGMQQLSANTFQLTEFTEKSTFETRVVSGSGSTSVSAEGIVTVNFKAGTYFEVICTVIDPVTEKQQSYRVYTLAPANKEIRVLSITK